MDPPAAFAAFLANLTQSIQFNNASSSNSATNATTINDNGAVFSIAAQALRSYLAPPKNPSWAHITILVIAGLLVLSILQAGVLLILRLKHGEMRLYRILPGGLIEAHATNWFTVLSLLTAGMNLYTLIEQYRTDLDYSRLSILNPLDSGRWIPLYLGGWLFFICGLAQIRVPGQHASRSGRGTAITLNYIFIIVPVLTIGGLVTVAVLQQISHEHVLDPVYHTADALESLGVGYLGTAEDAATATVERLQGMRLQGALDDFTTKARVLRWLWAGSLMLCVFLSIPTTLKLLQVLYAVRDKGGRRHLEHSIAAVTALGGLFTFLVLSSYSIYAAFLPVGLVLPPDALVTQELWAVGGFAVMANLMLGTVGWKTLYLDRGIWSKAGSTRDSGIAKSSSGTGPGMNERRSWGQKVWQGIMDADSIPVHTAHTMEWPLTPTTSHSSDLSSAATSSVNSNMLTRPSDFPRPPQPDRFSAVSTQSDPFARVYSWNGIRAPDRIWDRQPGSPDPLLQQDRVEEIGARRHLNGRINPTAFTPPPRLERSHSGSSTQSDPFARVYNVHSPRRSMDRRWEPETRSLSLLVEEDAMEEVAELTYVDGRVNSTAFTPPPSRFDRYSESSTHSDQFSRIYEGYMVPERGWETESVSSVPFPVEDAAEDAGEEFIEEEEEAVTVQVARLGKRPSEGSIHLQFGIPTVL